ncbi:coatomer subunit delta [Tribolium castaneum]|uniref:Coatomer subunit delta n=1 Tax=Tribolium castaneum TaxID=7070 RepID=D6WG69_TRICA|nr:PREDICTED: coatomer subunit delta [Tribolium castaneum]EFA00195.2 Coatomer subunit delta-like Protein [Tribolium castaneum]|eukprot:XP_967725.2 PREDICTED: coatomer subunit delta [Tribolium castaneum]
MVLIAAAVCTKAGKTIVSRQFVEMTKARIEGLLAAFPKLIPTGTQHTFVETDSVRYVYQPLERLYMLLITTRASNILEDLETLRLFAKVIPEYCRSLEENEIAENAFSLIFAFDEIVALGYRESVNLSQIRTFVEMDSHEERVYQAVRQTQEREAKNKMREKAKELQRQRMEANKKGVKPSFGSSGGFGSSSGYTPAPSVGDVANISNDIKPPAYSSAPQKPSTRGMKLGGKGHDVESFVDQLKSEGENVIAPVNNSISQGGMKTPAIKSDINDVHLRLEEKLIVRMGRDGGVQQFELLGLVTLHIGDEKWGRIRVQLENKDTRGIQLQTHPNVDKELFKLRSQIGLKQPSKPFPLHTDVGVLKWRLQSTDESLVPLLINCWPSEVGDGSCDINIEYELADPNLELADVNILIPLPMGCNPVVGECDGSYTHESRRNQLIWNLPIIDSSNKTGSLEFSAPRSIPNDFFPVTVSFSSKSAYANIKILDVLMVDDDSPVKYSVETSLFPDKYEIV